MAVRYICSPLVLAVHPFRMKGFPSGKTLLILLFAVFAQSVEAYPLTIEQRERLRRYLPRSFPKMENNEPMHVVAIGDSVMSAYTPLPSAWENGNILFTYPGVFLEKMALEWFYTGGMSLLNPPPGGRKKVSRYPGEQIRLENLATRDGFMLSGLQRTTTDAFLHKPDILLIQYGANDALAHTALDVYRRALEKTIENGKLAKADIIVLGPTPVNYGGGAMNWGSTRPYVSVAREVCAKHDVLFLDTGQHLMQIFAKGVDAETHPQAAMEVVGDSLLNIFAYGEELPFPERVHPGPKVHQVLGQALFDDLLNGTKPSDFSATAIAMHEDGGRVKVVLSLRNQTTEEKQGTIGALVVGTGMTPANPAQRFKIPAGKAAQLEFLYRRAVAGKTRGGDDLYVPLERDENTTQFCFVVEDTFGSEFLEVPLRVGPVSVAWKGKNFVNVTDRVRIEWDLVNGTDKAINGKYQIGMGESVAELVDFSLPPLGNKNFYAVFGFQGDAAKFQFQQDVWLDIHAEGKVIRFQREMEATRDMVVGQTVVMSPWASYTNAPPPGDPAKPAAATGTAAVRFDFDEAALRVQAAMRDIAIPDLGEKAALKVNLSIDARPGEEVRKFGFVDPLTFYFRGTDGAGMCEDVDLAAFGNGYNMRLDARGIRSTLSTQANGEKVIDITIPRSYLHRLGASDSLLGVKFEIIPAQGAQGFRENRGFVTHSSSFNFRNRTIHGPGPKDAEGLTTLRLSKDPVNSWSVRLY